MRLASSVPLSTCNGSVRKSPCALGLVLAGMLVVGLPLRAVRADTTLNSGTTTVSTATGFESYLYVATTGTATLNVITGGSVPNMEGYIGSDIGGVGTATVSGGTWSTDFVLTVGGFGTGMLNVTGGSVTNTAGYLGYTASGVGAATVSSGTWANSGDLIVGVFGTGTLTMTGGLVTVGGTLSQGDYGTINLNAGGTLQIGVGSTGGVLLSGTGSLVNNGTLIFNRSDASTYSGIISGTGAVTKQGGGTLTLTGTSSYTGATHVDGGALLVNGRLGNTAVLVASGGLLGGSGTIDGMLTVLAGGTLSPGNSPGTLHVGSLQLGGSSTTLMEISGTAAGLYDQIVGTGSGMLTYGGTLDLVMSGSYADQTTFHLFSNFSSPSYGDFAAVGLNATGEYFGLTFTGTDGVWTSTWTTNHQRLVFTTTTGDLVVVPEPSTVAMALAGLACGGWQMMRRRRLRQAAPLAV